MIEVKGLEKSYGEIKAVRGLSFSVGSGEVVGLLGPNGAGKTTTMRMLQRFLLGGLLWLLALTFESRAPRFESESTAESPPIILS